MPDGDAQRLRETVAILRATFRRDLAKGRPAVATNVRGNCQQFAAQNLTDDDPTTFWATDDSVTAASVVIELEKAAAVNRVVLQEHIELGQRVCAWTLEARVGAEWRPVAQGTTVGHKRIVCFPTLVASALRLNIIESLACPVLESFSAHAAPPAVAIHSQNNVFLENTTVELTADMPGCEIYYTLDGTVPDTRSARYSGPIVVRKSCVLRAAAAHDGTMSPHLAATEFVGYSMKSLRSPVDDAGEGQQGLTVAKYDGGWQTLDQMADRLPVVVGRCDNFDLNQRINDEHSVLAFETLLQVQHDGIYKFFLASDDGSRLYVGDSLVVDNDGIHGVTEKVGQLGLKAGLHPFRVEWFNAGAARD